ncbi:MAG: hypothetical protein FWG51_04615 [Firmicutes bacterium]|nr:hypothetical protein [Bacillota bacterium]
MIWHIGNGEAFNKDWEQWKKDIMTEVCGKRAERLHNEIIAENGNTTSWHDSKRNKTFSRHGVLRVDKNHHSGRGKSIPNIEEMVVKERNSIIKETWYYPNGSRARVRLGEYMEVWYKWDRKLIEKTGKWILDDGNICSYIIRKQDDMYQGILSGYINFEVIKDRDEDVYDSLVAEVEALTKTKKETFEMETVQDPNWKG